MLRITYSIAALAIVAAGGLAAIASGHDDPHGQLAFRRYLDLNNQTGAIFVADADGRHEHQVTTPLPGGLDDEPSWTPDGKRIIFTRQPAGDNPDVDRDVWSVRPDGRDLKLVLPACHNNPRCFPNEQRTAPRISPDGRQISFDNAWGDVRDDIDQIEFSELYVANVDGSNRHALTSFSIHSPFEGDTGDAAWSPDSRQLVFSHVNSALTAPAGATALYVINRDGSGQRRLTPLSLRAGGRAAWFPDGRAIAFRSVPAGDAPGGQIYTIRPDGSGVHQITHFSGDYQLGELSVSPDGHAIAFSKGGERRDLYVMRADGSGLHPITATALSENWPDWRPFS
jgi:Tol biopolymer transport system component